ncbi:hypothetical protein QJS04_geneDACA005767 [Acorus gramineus]|uniref:Uncharacterized protein n=1 Tax=Acorus gramineus TaxID=55184 RepID=A0AAV9BHR0_ACOGR|nr:hypothetical protein QJS04_geneDACA005767 [Acorus gramineus]
METEAVMALEKQKAKFHGEFSNRTPRKGGCGVRLKIRFGRSPAVKDFSAFALSTSAFVSTVTLRGGGLVVPDVRHRLRVRRRHHHRRFQRRDLATVLRREGYRVAVDVNS